MSPYPANPAANPAAKPARGSSPALAPGNGAKSAMAAALLFVPLIIGMGQTFGTQLPATAGAIATSAVAVDQARPA